MHRKLILVVISLFLSGCANQTMMRSHKSFEETMPRLKNVILLPPSVNVRLVDSGGGQGKKQYNYEDQLEGNITETLVEFLRAKNYKSRIVSRREIHNKKLSKNYSIFKDEFEFRMKSVYPTLLMDKEKAMDMNILLKRDFNEIVLDKDYDFFLMIDYQARNKTGGANFLTALTPGYKDPIEDAAESITIRATIIDAKNYRILWSNIVRDGFSALSCALDNFSSNDKVDRKRLKNFYKVLFKALPDKIGRQ